MWLCKEFFGGFMGTLESGLWKYLFRSRRFRLYTLYSQREFEFSLERIKSD